MSVGHSWSRATGGNAPAPLTVRVADPLDQFACIALDAGYVSDRTWQFERLDGPTGLTVQLRSVRLPRPRRVRTERDTEWFLRLWHGAAPFLVAERADTVIGWLAAWPEPEDGVVRLCECAVAPAERRRGVGHALMTAFLSDVDARGIHRVTASISTYNDPAAAWLVGCGWRLSGWDDDDGREVSRLQFSRSLKPPRHDPIRHLRPHATPHG